MKSNAKGLVDTLCKLYALGLMVLGVIFPASNLAAKKGEAAFTDQISDMYHIFLATVSISFFIFTFIYLSRRITHFEASEVQNIDDQDSETELRDLSRARHFSLNTSTTSTIIEDTAVDHQQNGVVQKSDDMTRHCLTNGACPKRDNLRKMGRSVSMLDIPTIYVHQYDESRPTRSESVLTAFTDTSSISAEKVPPAAILREGEAAYPNFYVRVGAVLFGVGALVTWGIAIISVVEAMFACQTPIPVRDMIKWILQAIFASLQMYFIFKYSKISINRYKVLCRFGIMHLLATNVCIWIQVIIQELDMLTKEIHQNRETNTTFAQYMQYDSQTHPGVTCYTNPFTSTMIKTTHFFFPLIIESSLIGAVSFFNIYENIGLIEKIRQKRRMNRLIRPTVASSTVLHFPRHQAVNDTCHKSFKGTFFGVILVAITVISCVVYNVHTTEAGIVISGAIFNFMEIGLMSFGIIATIVALYKMRALSIVPNHKKGPDETLLMIAAVGVYTLECFALFCYIMTTELETWMRVAGALSCCVALVQSTLQVLLVGDGIRRHTDTTQILRRKPGREAVVFLLLLNFALWMLYSFEIQGGVYNTMALIDPERENQWTYITKLCKPLTIFFRFHSTTCLYEIWKHSYKLKKSTNK